MENSLLSNVGKLSTKANKLFHPALQRRIALCNGLYIPLALSLAETAEEREKLYR